MLAFQLSIKSQHFQLRDRTWRFFDFEPRQSKWPRLFLETFCKRIEIKQLRFVGGYQSTTLRRAGGEETTCVASRAPHAIGLVVMHASRVLATPERALRIPNSRSFRRMEMICRGYTERLFSGRVGGPLNIERARPPQIRTRGFPASGSSGHGFADRSTEWMAIAFGNGNRYSTSTKRRQLIRRRERVANHWNQMPFTA